MRVTASVAKSWENQRRVLDKLYQIMEPGKEEQASYKHLAVAFNEGESVMMRAKSAFEEAGILKTRITYDRGDGNPGRVGHWTLLMDHKRAKEALEKYFDQIALSPAKPKAERRTTTKKQPEIVRLPVEAELVASVGPDPDSDDVWAKLRSMRKSDSEALVAAARQYLERGTVLDQSISNLKAAGINIDRSAITFDRDERLEHVALLLPLIDNYETRLRNIGEQVERYREKLSPYQEEAAEWKRRYEAVKRELDRRLASAAESAMVTNGERD